MPSHSLPPHLAAHSTARRRTGGYPDSPGCARYDRHKTFGIAGAEASPPTLHADLEDPIVTESNGEHDSAKARNWSYCEDFVTEDDATLRARERSAILGCAAITPGAGAALRALAAAMGARSVVEIGTGTGVASLWLLAGMHPDGVLTTIDEDALRHRAAKAAFAEGGIRSTRTRVITGRASDMLPRLTDGGYDIVLIGAGEHTHLEHTEQGLRLLRSGGALVLDSALAEDRVSDPTRRDEHTRLVRESARRLRDDDRLISVLLPIGQGLLIAVRR